MRTATSPPPPLGTSTTHETNANDWALDAEGVIDSSKLDATAGVWFGGTTPDDSKGALPYDTYLIEELRCTANEAISSSRHRSS